MTMWRVASKRTAVILAIIAAAGTAAILWRVWPSTPRRNVLLITLDTTRADRIGSYGYKPAETPALDGLAATGVMFDRCYTAVPLTLPSHATMLTGLYPPEHGLHGNGRGRLPESLPTLATILADRGYRTGAFLGSFVLDSMFGLDRGFETYDDDMTGAAPTQRAIHQNRSGQLVTDSALEWLTRSSNGPFFCWVHYYDAHSPYDPQSATFGDRFAGSPYDGEIGFVDTQIDRLIAFLREQELMDTTLIVVAGDHGESLGEHDEETHGFMLYEATMRVPLIVSGPQIGAGKQVPDVVRLVDLAPTILDWIGTPTDLASSGRTLLPATRGQALAALPSYGETDEPFDELGWSPLRSLIDGPWKFIKTPRPELYNLTDDPQELTNLIDREGDRADDMDKVLGDLIADMTVRQGEGVELSAEQQRALASLGYVAGNEPKPAGDQQALPDVKDLIRPHNAVERARALAPAESVTALEQVVQEYPAYLEARCALAEAHIEAGQPQQALRLSQQIVEEHPQERDGWFFLGTAKSSLGRDADAIADYEKALEVSPGSSGVHYNLGSVLLRLGRLEEARRHLEATLEADPGHVQAHIALGNIAGSQSDSKAEKEHYMQALRFDPENLAAHANLAALLMQSGEFEEATTHWRAAARIAPRNAQVRYNLGLVLLQLGKTAEALPELEEAVKLNPADRAATELLRQAKSSLPPQ